eukprot:scaffold311159_cov17-Tisochrysis_lutea.AAC.1
MPPGRKAKLESSCLQENQAVRVASGEALRACKQCTGSRATLLVKPSCCAVNFTLTTKQWNAPARDQPNKESIALAKAPESSTHLTGAGIETGRMKLLNSLQIPCA